MVALGQLEALPAKELDALVVRELAARECSVRRQAGSYDRLCSVHKLARIELHLVLVLQLLDLVELQLVPDFERR